MRKGLTMQHPSCPVCGFAEMPYPPVPFNVCPCCGTEYGVDDHKRTYHELRLEWIAAGKPWFSDVRFPRKGWSASLQLITAGYGADLIAPVGFVTRNQRETLLVAERPFWHRSELSKATPTGAPA